MRFIDPDIIREKISKEKPDWEAKATQVVKDIEALPEDKRSQAIKSKSKIWKELKKVLSEISHEKCWYCESKQDRSFNDVDHFRPKDKYWWLAFRWENYRFSCKKMNNRYY